MTDTSTPPAGGTPPSGGSNPQQSPALRVINQFVRDLSFENPSNRALEQQPNIELGIDVGATPHATAANTYEVYLKMNATAKAGETTLFMCELDYAGLFQLQGVPENQVEPMLLIECPRLLFPFARRIIAEITREGGFPPLLIDPVDFVGLYQNQRNQGAAGAAPQTAPPTGQA